VNETERLDAALAQLEAEGGAHLARDYRQLIDAGKMTAEQALESMDFAERLATERIYGEITDAQAGSLAEQLARRHLSGRRG
jgi:hypothetical protein